MAKEDFKMRVKKKKTASATEQMEKWCGWSNGKKDARQEYVPRQIGMETENGKAMPTEELHEIIIYSYVFYINSQNSGRIDINKMCVCVYSIRKNYC